MDRPGYSFLVCPDELLLKEELDRQTGALPDGNSWKKLTIWGDEDLPPVFWETLGQASLFAKKQIILLRHAELWAAAIWKSISAALARPVEHAWPFFCLEVEWEKGKPKIPAAIQKTPCFSYAAKKGWIWEIRGLATQTMHAYVKKHAESMGLQLTQQDIAAICSFAPPDARHIKNILEKFVLLAENGKINPQILAGESADSESNAFELVKKVVSGNMTGAFQEINAASDSGLLFFALALFAREFRTLWQICSGQPVRLHPAEANAKKALAKKLGFIKISRCMAELADAEWQVKSGRQSPEQVLESMAIRLHKHVSD